jgi:hypothetical protein
MRSSTCTFRRHSPSFTDNDPERAGRIVAVAEPDEVAPGVLVLMGETSYL